MSDDLIVERTFNAPVDLVFKAWTTPDLIMKWWGATGFTCPSATIDAELGGKYHLAMKHEEFGTIWSGGEFKEFVPNKKIVMTDHFSNEQGEKVSPTEYGMDDNFPEELEIGIDFEDQDGETKMTLTHYGLGSGEDAEMTKDGWNEAFDKLTGALTGAQAEG